MPPGARGTCTSMRVGIDSRLLGNCSCVALPSYIPLGRLYSALRAARCAFKIAPGDFVEPSFRVQTLPILRRFYLEGLQDPPDKSMAEREGFEPSMGF